jgi:hypothetical protein
MPDQVFAKIQLFSEDTPMDFLISASVRNNIDNQMYLKLSFMEKLKYARVILRKEKLEVNENGFMKVTAKMPAYNEIMKALNLKKGTMQHLLKCACLDTQCVLKLSQLAALNSNINFTTFLNISFKIPCTSYLKIFKNAVDNGGDPDAIKIMQKQIANCSDFNIIKQSIIFYLKQNIKNYDDVKDYVEENIDELLLSIDLNVTTRAQIKNAKKSKMTKKKRQSKNVENDEDDSSDTSDIIISFDYLDFASQNFIYNVKKLSKSAKKTNLSIEKDSIFQKELVNKNDVHSCLDLMFKNSTLNHKIHINYETGQIAVLIKEENIIIEQLIQEKSIPIPINFILIDPPYGLTDYSWDSCAMPLYEIADLLQTTKKVFKLDNAKCLIYHEKKIIYDLVNSVKEKKIDDTIYQKLNFKFGNICYWVKSQYKKTHSLFNQVEEFVILHNSVNLYHKSVDFSQNGNAFIFPAPDLIKNDDGGYLNSTQKSIEMEQFILSNYSKGKSDNLNLVFCAGTGTSVIASIRTGMNVIAFESNNENFKCMDELFFKEMQKKKNVNVFDSCIKHNGLPRDKLLHYVEKISKKQSSNLTILNSEDEDDTAEEEEEEERVEIVNEKSPKKKGNKNDVPKEKNDESENEDHPDL